MELLQLPGQIQQTQMLISIFSVSHLNDLQLEEDAEAEDYKQFKHK